MDVVEQMARASMLGVVNKTSLQTSVGVTGPVERAATLGVAAIRLTRNSLLVVAPL